MNFLLGQGIQAMEKWWEMRKNKGHIVYQAAMACDFIQRKFFALLVKDPKDKS